jgi:hypothetical protein
VDRAILGQREPRLSWLQASVWLRARLGDLAFIAEGRHLRAPGQRFRLDMHTHLDETVAANPARPVEGQVLSVCDGRDLWSAQRVSGEAWTNVTRLRTAQLLDGPATAPPVLRNEFLGCHALRGTELMLYNMQSHMEWVRREDAAEGVRLTGRWKDWARANLLQGRQVWPALVPRYCRLTLSGDRPWPARVEYWGPREEGGPDSLLVEMEFREPVFDRPLPEDECARLFSFDAGDSPVEDLTQKMQQALIQRGRDLHVLQP